MGCVGSIVGGSFPPVAHATSGKLATPLTSGMTSCRLKPNPTAAPVTKNAGIPPSGAFRMPYRKNDG
ncbi:hypothetical protein BE18_06980 [Sorangium cellulosum]|uniref:Uncharacterized protein n=1 Tax=Sorangium cellulosum TaxID=56 RepID=A0A150RP00_SORCE|nr:hypothetical protein BE18_06980 [Sorangium cellulosum]